MNFVFVCKSSIPKYFIWLRYLSWFGYANQVLVVNQWHDVELAQCPPNSTFCFSNGDQLITYLKIDKVIHLILFFFNFKNFI